MDYGEQYKDCQWMDFDILENFMKQVLQDQMKELRDRWKLDFKFNRQ